MGFYIYCVVPANHPLPGHLHGLSDAQVVSRTIAGLDVWLSESDRPEPGVESAKIHNRVVEAAVTEEVTPVPARFGQWAADFQSIEKSIADKAAWYRDRLQAFRAALEFGVRVLSPAKQGSAQVLRSEGVATGLEYMKALRDRAAAAQAERDDVERISAIIAEILGVHARETKLEQPRSAHGLINVVHLVARNRFDEYRAAAETLKARLPDRRFLLSGPWVPYSFAV